jgi:phenylacetate-CoA ligase
MCRFIATSTAAADWPLMPSRTSSDLERLPTVSKAVYRERGMEAFCAENLPAYRRLERATSGSTGEPFRFYLDRAALPVIFASHIFYDSWYGLRPFDRYVRVIAPPAAPSELPQGTPALFRLRQAVTARLQRFYENRTQRKVWLWEVNEARAKDVWRTIEDFKPGIVMGYTSTLAALAGEWLQRGLRLNHPARGVIVIAETLTPVRRRVIEQYFQAPIINRYGLREKNNVPAIIRRELGKEYEGTVLFTERHESHAASAFYPSPFRSAATVTVDGVGEWAMTTIDIGEGNKLRLLMEIRFPH